MVNVWEWTASRWTATAHPDELPQRPAASDEMTKRAAPFMCHKSYCYRYRCAARSQNTPILPSANIGISAASNRC
uniref:FGE-sulfatase domain-containing protein n=1 Tax=Macrostomum lignano TaxID=282301 RepID=A0A1I8FM34_9PLAT